MKRVRELFRKFQSMDGKIKIGTLSGVTAVAAAIALLVGVLPAVADHVPPGSGPLVAPTIVAYGGGSGACSATLTDSSGNPRLPSAAGREYHINNPVAGTTYTNADGISLTVKTRTADPTGLVFDFSSQGTGFVVYDVIVNGGPQNTHYDYDRDLGAPVDHDNNLRPPQKNKKSLFNLSHINVCYDVPGVSIFVCDNPVTLTDSQNFTHFEQVIGRIFDNGLYDCATKRASYVLDNEADPPTVTLTFAGDGSDTATGRLDFTKRFSSPADFVPLKYNPVANSFEGSYDLSWCNTRPFDSDASDGLSDGTEFSDWLGTDDYPSLVGVVDDPTPESPGSGDESQATACKVAEDEDLTGKQVTVVYFEFVDPHFY